MTHNAENDAGAGGSTKPPFAYYGGKTTLAPQIAALLPKHDHYVEPFAGSLAVLLAKRRSQMETVNDLDRDLVTFWKVLRDQPGELARVAAMTPHSRAEYEASRDLVAGLSDLERARRVWVRLTQSRSQSMKPTGWKYIKGPSVHGRMASAARVASFADRMESVALRMRNVSLECRDALEVIRDYGKHASVCIYADPPYLGSVRATNYGQELLNDEQHVALAEALRACRASIVLSGYTSELYDDLFRDWHRVEMRGATTQSGATDRMEVLWSNRPLGEPDLFSALDLAGGAA